MKKFILLIAAAAILTLSAPSMSADITVGAATWYSWWDMDATESPDSFEFDPAFLYGPVFAVKFNDDFGLNAVFLYGEFDGDYTVDFGAFGMRDLPSKTTRYDSDISLSYRINDYFKIYGGLKYTGYTFKTEAVPSLYMPAVTVKNTALGPAAGISCVYHLVDSFFILANGSVMYLWGEAANSVTTDEKAVDYGYNAAASLAYYISSASVTLSLGGRYQYIKLVPEESNGMESNHKFYGVTGSATYSFSL